MVGYLRLLHVPMVDGDSGMASTEGVRLVGHCEYKISIDNHAEGQICHSLVAQVLGNLATRSLQEFCRCSRAKIIRLSYRCITSLRRGALIGLRREVVRTGLRGIGIVWVEHLVCTPMMLLVCIWI